MSDIDRRTLLAVAGSGLLLASCKEDRSPQATAGSGKGIPAGLCDDFGDPVSKEAPGTSQASDFVPEYICVVYIVRHPDGIKVRHAYWRAEADTAKQAKKRLIEISRGNYSTVPNRSEQNFQRFGFNSRTKIYFFINDKPDEFGFMPGSVDRKIRFAPISANEAVTVRMAENSAFYNMQPINYQSADSTAWPFPANESGYSLDYWNLNIEGKPITNIDPKDPGKYYLFSMNIHLLQKKKELPPEHNPPTPSNAPVGTPMQDHLPLILDPDTGNMGGDP